MKINHLELFSVIMSIIGTFLTVRQKLIRWPLDIFLLLINLYIHHKFNLYDRWILTGINLSIDFYGWYRWKFGGMNKTELKVSDFSFKNFPYIILLGGLFSGIIYYMLLYVGSDMPLLGAFRTGFAYCALWLASQKKQEHWLLWIFLNLISVYMYFTKGLYFFSLKYIWYIIFNIWGFIQWNRSIKK